MRKLELLLLVAGIALPAYAVKRVTVEQLAQVMASAHGKPDAKVARELSILELTERFSAARLSRWEPYLPGPESRRSLVLLADMSAFLDPPASEIPAAVTPDLSTQRHIMAMAVDYAVKAVHQLPNFIAVQNTIHFEDGPAGQTANASFTPYQPLHAIDRTTATVLYRDGQEVLESKAAKSKPAAVPSKGLATSGEFGPILGTVLVDAAQGTLAWSHWEQSADGPLVVFRYAVTRERSHYLVEFCCVLANGEDRVFKQNSGYHGEITVDPANGVIRRLTLEADLVPSDKIVQADILVEYGPVEIGGETYICPVKSISIARAPFLASTGPDWSIAPVPAQENADAPLQTLLNDVVFDQYRVFRSDARVLTGADAEHDLNAAPSESATSASADLPAPPAQQEERRTAGNQPPTPAANSPPPVMAAPADTFIPPPAQPVEPAAPEISVVADASLPNVSTSPNPIAEAKGLTLRVTARLVDVDVVALDKKGQPVRDLKPENFAVYDNGRLQAVQFFSRAAKPSAALSAKASGKPGAPPRQLVYSNRREDPIDTKPGAEATESSATILLIDANNLAWADLTYAREQIQRFLQKIPDSELVGIYVQTGRAFQVLVEGTADHALLASTLRKWMPDAQDLARAQEEEQRNRQQFDYVLHPADLQSVNGNIDTVPDTATGTDPKLRDYGSNPASGSMSILARIAQHLASIPGHKNLVWVSSDNVLANWRDQAVGADKGSKHIEGFVLRAQEALNDAQVSLYPLDASQLETMAVDPGLENPSIKLAPGVTAPPPPQGGSQATGRAAAELQQDIHPVQVAIQEMAEATGGRIFRRSGNIAANLDSVVEDARATYLLGFTPDAPADDQYHRLTVKVTGRRGVKLRYRTGYLYSKEAATLKDRFRQAIWQPLDANEVALTAHLSAAYSGATLRLNIGINDLALELQGERWKDKLDIFVVHRDEDGHHARIAGRTLVLALQPATYKSLLETGVPFEQFVERTQDTGSIRIVVVDENSGRIGSVTFPSEVLRGST
ncbi:MAG: VWA domain-containing protein [Terracidiphilus sp.]